MTPARFQFTTRQLFLSTACFAVAAMMLGFTTQYPAIADIAGVGLFLSLGAGIGLLFGRPILGAVLAVIIGFALIVAVGSVIFLWFL